MQEEDRLKELEETQRRRAEEQARMDAERRRTQVSYTAINAPQYGSIRSKPPDHESCMRSVLSIRSMPQSRRGACILPDAHTRPHAGAGHGLQDEQAVILNKGKAARPKLAFALKSSASLDL